MVKHTDSLATLDQELFPGLREEKDRKRWWLRKWAFAIMLSLGLAICSGRVWLTGGEQVHYFAEQAPPQNIAQNQLITRTSQAPWLGERQRAISDTVAATKAIPKGTLVPVEIESAQFGGMGHARILARTQAYVFPDKTVVIPAGSEVRGIAGRHGDMWEIHWNSVSVLSVGGRQADIQAVSEIPGKASLNGRSLLVKAN
jgi:hypothetical protein